MNGILNDRYIVFSLASVCMIILVCAVTAYNTDGVNGNGMTEIEGIISDPVPSRNGTVFSVTDLKGNEIRCFYGSGIPDSSSLCRLIGSFSSDGNMFFADKITVIEKR